FALLISWFDVEAVGKRVFNFIGVADQIGAIEADHPQEVIYSGDIPVRSPRFDRVFHSLAKDSLFINLFNPRRTHFEFAFEVPAIQWIVNRFSNGERRLRSLVLRIKSIAYGDSGAEGPTAQTEGQCQSWTRVAAAQQIGRTESRTPP